MADPQQGGDDRSVTVENNDGIIITGDHPIIKYFTPPPESPPPPENSPAGKANLLAEVVGGFLKSEEEQLRLWDPAPLPLRFRAVSPELAAGCNIGPVLRTGSSEVLPLDQPLKDLAAAYEGKEPGRLLVLGRAGSGKTVLIRRFAMDRLKARGPYGSDPVPVIFSLGSWDPHKTSLRNWLIGRLERDYPFLAGDGPGGRSWADTLVMTECVLAILDGFDEIADGLHKKALRDLSAVTLPVLLTSRRPEIEAAAAKSSVSFDGIELTDLTLDDVAGYLLPGAGAARGTDPPATGTTGWEYVLNRLRLHPDEPACARLTAVLTTPLMVELARAVHRSGRDPARLLTGRELDTREALEDHLLDRFVPAAYARFLSARSDGKHRTWPAERSRHWLGYLATHLRQLDTHDIEWWRLGTAMSLSSRMVASGAVIGFVSGVLTVLPSGYLISLHVIIVTFLNMLGNGLAFGFLQGLMSSAGAGGGFQPSRMHIRIRGGSKRVKQNLLPRIRSGLAGGLVFGVVYGLGNAVYVAVAGFPWLNVFLVFMDWFLVGLGVGLGTGLVLGLMTGVEAVIETKASVSPADLLRTNRTTVLTQILVTGLIAGIGFGVVVTAINGFAIGVGHGITMGVMVALGSCTLTAWGRWIVLVRLWLPLTGRLPWAVNAFLDDACQRGVLRQAGAVHQFRHARLRDRMAEVHGRRECEREQPTEATGVS
ncbi:NACHT domain-containing protein [Streptomyces anulatus]|uniref:NACHT domain-containing protein n=1 Tax=Streptomyces TaxID=1883 RepID=UPI000BFC666F|nr:NACHT domain-containing protein [Streptomyces sp. or3]WTC76173.1 NACHT domain-containing protein [Streptomyces anulatus]